MSCVRCHLSPVTCHLSKTLTATARDLPLANSLIMHSMLEPSPYARNNQTIPIDPSCYELCPGLKATFCMAFNFQFIFKSRRVSVAYTAADYIYLFNSRIMFPIYPSPRSLLVCTSSPEQPGRPPGNPLCWETVSSRRLGPGTCHGNYLLVATR